MSRWAWANNCSALGVRKARYRIPPRASRRIAMTAAWNQPLFQELADEGVQPNGNVKDNPRGPLRNSVDMLQEHVHGGLGLKGPPCGEQLVEEHTQRVKIRFVGQVAFAATLLRRHVGGGA